MKSNKLCDFGLGLAAITAVLEITAYQPATAATLSYTVEDLGSFSTPEASTSSGINSLGQVVGQAGAASAALFSDGAVTNLGILPNGNYSNAFSINDASQIVGVANIITNNQSESRAFLYSDGNITDLNSLIPANSGLTLQTATSINNSGQVVGETNQFAAFLYDNGEVFNLNSLIPADSGLNLRSASDINDSGQVVGSATTAEGGRAFLYSNGQALNLGTLDFGFTSPSFSNSSSAAAVNNSGQVVGTAIYTGFTPASTLRRAFLYSNGAISDLGILPGYARSTSNDINDLGQVVGYSDTGGGFGGGRDRAFLYSDGELHDLNDLIPADSGWTLSSAEAINNSGQIAGTGSFNGRTRAFLATPVPTSSSILGTSALSVLGAGFVMRRRWRCKTGGKH